jgi:single-strand DNA-binding protein
MLNKVVLIGRLVKDPELRNTQSGKAVANFIIAVDRPYVADSGEREADFIPIVAWNKTAENIVKYLGKGRLIAVAGRMQVRNYEKDNVRHYVTEVIADDVRFLDRAPEESEASAPPQQQDPYDQIPF